ncbi:MAG: hypothetical protein H0X24_24300, partial [Ktedonobacterales bacterium]|nr:hypothetical protein [Ktedonobacterales bacterium]
METHDLARPAFQDRSGWRTYWDQQGAFWRTEPEILTSRQDVLLARLKAPDQSPAPLAGMRLDRADVEWLLARHQSRGVQGPIDADDV